MGEVCEQTAYVVRMVGDRRTGGRVVEATAGESAAVVGEDRVVVGDMAGEIRTAIGIAFTALRDQQQRAVAGELVVEDCPRNVECGMFGECIELDALIKMHLV